MTMRNDQSTEKHLSPVRRRKINRNSTLVIHTSIRSLPNSSSRIGYTKSTGLTNSQHRKSKRRRKRWQVKVEPCDVRDCLLELFVFPLSIQIADQSLVSTQWRQKQYAMVEEMRTRNKHK